MDWYSTSQTTIIIKSIMSITRCSMCGLSTFRNSHHIRHHIEVCSAAKKEKRGECSLQSGVPAPGASSQITHHTWDAKKSHLCKTSFFPGHLSPGLNEDDGSFSEDFSDVTTDDGQCGNPDLEDISAIDLFCESNDERVISSISPYTQMSNYQ